MKLSAILAPMIAAGVDGATILATVQAFEEQQSDALEKRRANDRERQERRRHVKSRDVTVTVSSHAGATRGEDNLLPEEITGKKENKEEGSPSARSSRGTRIPDDFVPDIASAVTEGVPRLNAEREAKSFCDFWRSKPGKDGLKLDWPATWRVWYRRSIPQRQAIGPPKPQTIGEMFREDARRNGILNDQPPATSSGRMEAGNGSGEVPGSGDARIIALTRDVLGGFG